MTRRPFDLGAYGGKSVGLRVRYVDRRRAQGNPDDTAVTASSSTPSPITAVRQTLFSDGAETSANGWTLDRFASIGATDP